jgi:hypothetical protein
MDKEPLNFDARGAAEYLGVSVGLVRQDVVTKRHGFPFVKIGRRVVYPADLLRQFRDAHTHNQPTDSATH